MTRPARRISGVVVTGPLIPFIDAYRRELKGHGYTARSAVSQLRQVSRFSRWLEARGSSVSAVSAGVIEEFPGWQREGGRHRAEWSRPGLACLVDVLSGLHVLADSGPVQVRSPRDAMLASFERYLLAERGLAAGTVRGYVDHARCFLGQLRPGIELADVTAAEVTTAVLGRSVAVPVSATRNFVSGLRAFLRFCVIEGLVSADLSQAALPVTGRRRSTLPAGITTAGARALPDSCDRRSALGRRDYALIITLLRLGLRRSEVARLRLDDIDWRAAEVVVRGKGAREGRLPLPVDAGKAIASYLRRGRRATDRRELFLQARAPYEPIASATVASAVRRACRRAGIAEVGSHRLRHTMACEMISAGVPLVEIAQVLRHHSLQTTAVYARVDLDRLRRLAAPWPGRAQR